MVAAGAKNSAIASIRLAQPPADAAQHSFADATRLLNALLDAVGGVVHRAVICASVRWLSRSASRFSERSAYVCKFSARRCAQSSAVASRLISLTARASTTLGMRGCVSASRCSASSKSSAVGLSRNTSPARVTAAKSPNCSVAK